MKISLNSPNISGASSGGKVAGKGCMTLFFGVFFLMGMLFVVLILGDAARESEPWLWPEVPCTIRGSDIGHTGDDERPYKPIIRYQYEFEGQWYEGSRVSRRENGTASYDRARDTFLKYPEGASVSCRVNPDHPSLSVLERRIPWIVFLVFFPLIFVAIGAGGLWASWRNKADGQEDGVQSISQNASTGKGHRFALGLGGLFIIVGGLVFTFLFAVPAVRTLAATSWQPIPCNVVRSTVRSWSTDDGTSYRPDVLYQYDAGGKPWVSNRVTFFSALSTGRTESRAVRDRYPSGASSTCWVDPDDPSRSVLDRGFRPFYLLGLLPLLFVIAGAAVARWAWRQLQTEPAAGDPPAEKVEMVDLPVQLEPQMSPLGKVVGTLFFALFWNGIVSIFVWQAWKAWQSGHPDWFLTVFLVPFVLVGIASFVFVGHFTLALANPRPRITLPQGDPSLGDDLRIDWRFSGRPSRLTHLKIFLEGREEATYQRGTDTVTEREVFATLPLVDTANDWEIPRGSATVGIPDDTMHSFAAGNNKILWEIKVSGEIPKWPDINQNFPITLHPLRLEDV